MCLATTQPGPLYAIENISVYKVITKRFHRDYLNQIIDDNKIELVAPYLGFKYEQGVLYETKILETDEEQMYDYIAIRDFQRIKSQDIPYKIIAEGFHSIYNIHRNLMSPFELFGLYGPNGLFRCMVPKGAEYYKDNTGLMVSNKIIIGNEVDPNELKNSRKNNMLCA